MTRFGTLVSRIDVRSPGIDLPLLSVSQTRGVLRQSELSDRPPRADSLDSYKVCRRDDIVFNKMSIRAGAMGVAQEDGLVTYHYEVMRPKSGVDPRYVVYLMKSSQFTRELIRRERGIGAGSAASGVRTTEVPFSVMRTIDLELPEVGEQRRIAEFLDRETTQIDELIVKQEQLISTLAERYRSRVTAFVTGLEERGMPTRRTGVAWWPELPATWSTPKVVHHFDVVLGKMLDAGRETRLDEMETPYIRAANIQESGLHLDDLNSMPMTPSEIQRLDLRAGDLVVVEGGAVGVNQYLDESLSGLSFQKTVNRVRPRGNGSAEYLGLVLDVLRWGGVIDMICNKSTIAHFTAEKLAAIRIPWPSVPQQRDIARDVRSLRDDVASLTEKAHATVQVLRERRQALISAVVTGVHELPLQRREQG